MAINKRSPILEALDAESYDYLGVTAPELLTAVETEIVAGKTPDQIMRLVAQHIGPDRQALAYRCFQAANYITKTQG